MWIHLKNKVGITISGRGQTEFRPDTTVREIIDNLGEPYKSFRTSKQHILMYLSNMAELSDKDNLIHPLIIRIEKGRISSIDDCTSNAHIEVVTDKNTKERQFLISIFD